MQDPKKVYTDRVDWYLHGRPTYPDAVLDVLDEGRGLKPDRPVADVGSGTGMLTRVFLDNGNLVYAVEPNASMRSAAEGELRDRPNFVSVAGTAEETGLDSGSVDVVAVGQALHWFDLDRARAEFRRVLRPGGEVLRVWNEQPWGKSALLADLHAALLDFAPQYADNLGSAPTVSGLADAFFDGAAWARVVLPNNQSLDRTGLLGRVFSSSYAPAPQTPQYDALQRRVVDLHRRHARNGKVVIEYQTFVIHGRISGDSAALNPSAAMTEVEGGVL